MKTASPLRYPGGKWRLSPFFERLIALNNLRGQEYVEPYAGGGSLALNLLFSGAVRRIHLNDLAASVYCVWWAMLKHPSDVVRFIETVPLTAQMWQGQKEIYSRGPSSDRLAFACAVLYLNRTNHSGILNGGMIGGKQQRGKWRIDARFNRDDLARRVLAVAARRSQIKIHNSDGQKFLSDGDYDREGLVYLDPPYVQAGRTLYLNAYKESDHKALSEAVRRYSGKWVVSYDAVPVVRRLYEGFSSRRLELLHTARDARVGEEILFFSPGLRIPRCLRIRSATG